MYSHASTRSGPLRENSYKGKEKNRERNKKLRIFKQQPKNIDVI